MSKNFKQTVEVNANDFPNDLPKRRADLEKAALYAQLSSFKDKVISELVTKSTKQLNRIREEFDESASEEIQEWST